MADENLDQRLAAIEAAIPTLATRADLEALAAKANKIEDDITSLTEKVTAALVEFDKARAETRYVSGLMGGIAMAGASLADYVRALAERVERLERRGEG